MKRIRILLLIAIASVLSACVAPVRQSPVYLKWEDGIIRGPYHFLLGESLWCYTKKAVVVAPSRSQLRIQSRLEQTKHHFWFNENATLEHVVDFVRTTCSTNIPDDFGPSPLQIVLITNGYIRPVYVDYPNDPFEGSDRRRIPLVGRFCGQETDMLTILSVTASTVGFRLQILDDRIIVEPQLKDDAQQSIGDDSGKSADGLTGAPQR